MPGIKRLPGETDDEYWDRVEKIIDGLNDNVIIDGQHIATLPPGTLGGKEIVKSLTGILKGNYDLDEIKTERLREKYDLVH